MTDRMQHTAVVIGASGSIGSVIVEQLCRRELDVIGVDIAPASTQEKNNYRHIMCDFSKTRSVDKVLSAAARPPEYIINMAGGATSEEVDGHTIDSIDDIMFQTTLASNLVTSLSAIQMARRAARPDRAREVSLVLCSSINAVGNYQYPIYSASKAGVESLVYSQSASLGQLGIRLNCIRLGTVVTTASLQLHGDENAPHYTALRNLTCLGRFVTAQQAARAFVAAAVDMAGMTGVVIPVDAGQSVPGLRTF